MRLEVFHQPETVAPSTARRQDWWRIALLAWGIILLVIGVRGFFFHKTHNTFFYYANAGRNWLEGVDLYQRQADTCRYSPLVTAMLVPFSMMPERAGALLWRLLNAGVFLGGLYAWSRRVLPGLSAGQRGLLFLGTIPLA